ncbi:type II secretion system secretin GspD [Pseudomonas sp. NP21570]|jgi:general secretion pathway protein D|uniref:Type II secretion system secretin GspD n=1 Tax=Stutzerimonas chloritidismutans TaxID=203192 RepID=A0ACC5VIR8_STUCH|nr:MULTISPECIES: type II secretion system secretin GspD [Stutzerimonas stutzeri group]KKJ95394.1 general secretion pathway protein GspD [Stutzerimonas stutzeri]MAF86304.1 type II secretion system protein GspD [Pseudomonas sp.]MCB4794466.1 type II secretion system secretin GspD [Pseudomonas sp. NP21570]OHC17797.1 MAG: type II secretion system protein GspD [Pseudomonadales bacterium GWC2_63_15]PKM13383.1 MAG: type II secretion system protein GspD [Gammaproteobacteria bacterium HGW-Gammaproteobac|tara:strand:+ start:3347 stop:5284 length:1938 start_codon:yes stop_codon:yes gene_type:complete
MPKPFSRPLLALLATGLLAAPLPLLAVEPGIEPSPNQQDGWTINLKDADIRAFIDQISQLSGQTFIVDPRVKGQVSVVSNATLSLSEVYQLFLSVMATHGFSVLTQGDVARVVPNAEAKAEAGSGPTGGDQLETRVIQVQHTSAAELIPLIRPLVPQFGHLAAVSSANALIISDRSANIARIEDLVRQLDRAESNDYAVLNLQHGWAMDIAEVLRNSLMRGDAKTTSGVQIIADSRTNRLIFIGPSEARGKLAALAQSLDTPTTRSANTRVIRLRHNDAKSLAETLGDISEGLKNPESGESATSARPQNILIRADESLNALVLLADPELIGTLESIVRQLDVPRAQVMVEAAIVEVSGDITDALGVQWAVDARGGTGGAGGVSFGNTGISVGSVLNAINENEIPENLPDGAIIGVGTRSFGALITALSSNSKSNLLSTPSLLTLDNQEAEILVGQNVPFQTGSYTTDAAGANNPFTTIERQDIGVTLKVTPHINEGATLRLQIEQEISSIAPSASLTAQAVDLVTNKRAIKSTILAEDGQVIVLGGLIQDDVTRTNAKVPLLGDIPFLGALFRSTQETHVKRNLMVFLRPTVIRDRAGLAALSGKKYSDIRVIETDSASPSILPANPAQLFDGRGEPAPAIDLRQ